MRENTTTRQQKVNIAIYVIEKNLETLQRMFDINELYYTQKDKSPDLSITHKMLHNLIISRLQHNTELLTIMGTKYFEGMIKKNTDWNENRSIKSVKFTSQKLLKQINNFAEKGAEHLNNEEIEIIKKYSGILQEIYDEAEDINNV